MQNVEIANVKSGASALVVSALSILLWYKTPLLFLIFHFLLLSFFHPFNLFVVVLLMITNSLRVMGLQYYMLIVSGVQSGCFIRSP